MIRLIINTIKLLIKKRSYIIGGIILPAFIIVFFSFEFVGEYKFKVGVIDNDNSYASNEIIKTIDDLEDIQSIEIKEEDYEILLMTQQIQMAITIDNNFQENLLKSKNNEIKIQSISDSDVNETVKTMIELKCEDLSMISKLSNGDINKFKEIIQQYNDGSTKLSLNDVNENRPKIENSLGLIIFFIFIMSGNIVNFLIEDEENKTKIRELNSGVSKWKYYASLIFVFYLMSSITILIYYILSLIFNIDFGMKNSLNFLIVMLLLNLVALSFNLCIVTFTRSRYTSGIVNVLIIVPCCMLSGVFWNFNMMPKSLQEIGKFIPTRWVYICIENLQNTDNLNNVNIYLNAMIILSIILFIISFIRLRLNKEI